VQTKQRVSGLNQKEEGIRRGSKFSGEVCKRLMRKPDTRMDGGKGGRAKRLCLHVSVIKQRRRGRREAIALKEGRSREVSWIISRRSIGRDKEEKKKNSTGLAKTMRLHIQSAKR